MEHHVQQRPTASITPSQNVTFGDEGQVFISAVDGGDVRILDDEPGRVVVRRGRECDYTVTKGVVRLTTSWNSPAVTAQQQVAVDINENGKVEVISSYLSKCGAKGELLNFYGCKVRLGGTALQAALEAGYWKEVSTPQQGRETSGCEVRLGGIASQTASVTSHRRAQAVSTSQQGGGASAPHTRLVETLTFDSSGTLVTVSSTTTAQGR